VNLYTLRNKADKPRLVLVEQPYEADWKLAEPAAPTERTGSLLRFRVTVPPGHSAPLKVVMERTVQETLALVDADVDLLLADARQTPASPALAAALRQVVERRGRLADLQRQRAQHEAEIQAMDQEQTRIRQNMQQLDRQSALYQRYVAKLNEQETSIEKLRTEIRRLRDAETEAQRSLQAYLDGLEVT
jgi:predicted RNase H-like nuclease (RuvC/YqgF family)